MSFQPAILGNGIGGFRVLERTYDTQFEVFRKSPELERDVTRFLEQVGEVSSAEDLVKNREVLKVALGAFNLQDDIQNRYFLKKILEDGVTDPRSLANRLGDRRYRDIAEFFGFGPGETPATNSAEKMQEIVERYRELSFEAAVGLQDNGMRVALYGKRELVELAQQDMSERAKWFTLMADPPLRSLMESALGLPTDFGQIDLDQQVNEFRRRFQSVTGSSELGALADDEQLVTRLTDIFLAREQVKSFNAGLSGSSIALGLLQSAQSFASNYGNL